MYTFRHAYPTPQHEQAAQFITTFFAQQAGVAAVLLTCSCARGKASRDSCLDMAILLADDDQHAALEQAWHSIYPTESVFQDLLSVGQYSHVDLEIVTGQFDLNAYHHGWTTGPDEFELAVGNLLAYSVPLWTQGDMLDQLKARWLPYYDEALRAERLVMVRRFCLNNLDHIPPYIERGLYFQAFRRLYNALGEFLQALFISRRVYPIAYDKWVKEQIVDILGLPELYPQIVSLLEVRQLESRELADKANTLAGLLERYTEP
jgi:hypothetical protein